ncbi:MAG: 3-dehydroquinate synthase [Gammaproteobacteria bacterium]|nr:3-dehydroquinate synthase [Gammaproteobacteria bacterium]
MKVLNVELGERSYPIYIGSNLLQNKDLIQKSVHGKQVVIVTNETIAPLYLDQAKQLFSDYQIITVVLADGEQYKTLDGLSPILNKMLENHIDRRVTLIALGGGVIGDMTGFAAAIYRRGVNFIQIPTTLLSQVDSSVGGKTGVNHPLGKNMIGAFYQPQCVIADTLTLNTLDDRQLSSGISEVIKYALINDSKFLEWLEENMDKLLNRDPEALSYIIEKSCQSKATIVANDEREAGQRALLNLGHTFGHAIETLSGYGNCLHGEAIAIGMMMAADLSLRHGWLDEKAIQRMENLFIKACLPTKININITIDEFLNVMKGDKKVLDGELNLVLFKNEATSFISSKYEYSKLIETLNSFTKK